MKRFMDRKLGHRFGSRRERYELFLSRVDTQLGSDGHFPLTPALIGIPKVIHHRRGSLWKLAAADVNNFCGCRLLTCEQLCVALEKERHATGMTNTLAHVYHASGETFAPSHFPLTATNTQRLPFCRPSIR